MREGQEFQLSLMLSVRILSLSPPAVSNRTNQHQPKKRQEHSSGNAVRQQQ